MSEITVVTERDLKGANPLYPSSGLSGQFVLMNMNSEGIWLVDRMHNKFPEIKETAIKIAAAFGDKATIDKLSKIEAMKYEPSTITQ